MASIRWKERLEQLYVAVYLISGIVMAVRSYLSAEKLQTRWQLKWMAWGSVCGFLPAALFYLAPLSLGIRVGTWSELSVLPMALVPLTFAAAIVHYRLLDLDVFVKRGTVAIGLLLTAAATYAACYVVMDRMTGGEKRSGIQRRAHPVDLPDGDLLPPHPPPAEGAVDQFFYRERYDYRRTLIEFGEALNREPACRPWCASSPVAWSAPSISPRCRSTCATPAAGALVSDVPIGAIDAGRSDPWRCSAAWTTCRCGTIRAPARPPPGRAWRALRESNTSFP